MKTRKDALIAVEKAYPEIKNLRASKVITPLGFYNWHISFNDYIGGKIYTFTVLNNGKVYKCQNSIF